MQNKVHDKCAHHMPDDCWGMMVCSSVFQGTQSSFSRHLDSSGQFFWSRWLALSLSLNETLSLTHSNSLSLSHSNSLELSLTQTFSLSLTQTLSLSFSQTFSLSLSLTQTLSLSHSLAPGSLFKNWHWSACSQKHLSGQPFQNSKAAPSSLRSSVEVVVVVGPPYVMSFMSTRRCKACEETAGFYARRAKKIFSQSRHSARQDTRPHGTWKRCTRTPFRGKRSRWTAEVSQKAIRPAEESCFLPTTAAPDAIATVQYVWLEICL